MLEALLEDLAKANKENIVEPFKMAMRHRSSSYGGFCLIGN
jgi:hypothetical protein